MNERDASSARTKILVVDDVPANIKTMTKVINALGLDVEIMSVQSGLEALNLVIDHDFALTLLDVQMPDMNGFEVAELMRGRRESRHIPIIFVTAGTSDEQQMFKGYEAGAVDFLRKPFDPAALESKVRIFVELYDSRNSLKRNVEEITRQKDELARLKLAAEAANEAKTSFLSNISHEIRTPLGAILGFADLLQAADQSHEERDECIETIRRNGQHLLNVINDVLDMSKIEAGRLEVDLTEVALPDVLLDIERAFQFRVNEKGLKFSISGDIPSMIRTDATRLKQILINIIGNAIKFTAKGVIEVKVCSRDQHLVFAVKDSGIGLTPDQTAGLFQPFIQSESSISRNFGGTGLGLVISRQLAQALGGDVIISNSVLGQGSTFEISIDAGPITTVSRPPSQVVQPLMAETVLRNLKVLLVDDSRDNRILLHRILIRFQAEVAIACDGQEGMDMALSGNYDVILMDVQMPVMDGLEATQRLRDRGFDRPIIALTAHAFKEDALRFLAAGYSDHLSKPIDVQRMVEQIHQHCRVGGMKKPDPDYHGHIGV